MTNREKIIGVINDYVSKNGPGHCMSTKDIRGLIEEKYAGIKGGSLQLTDYCYNVYNENLKDGIRKFECEDRIFQKLDKYTYKILGSGYPYTGEAYHTPKDTGIMHVEGEWVKGKFFKKSKDEVAALKLYSMEAEVLADKIDVEAENTGLEGKEKEQLVKARVNQGKFREQLKNRYKHCCLCGVSNDNLLIASHIKPWAVSEAKEKLDINNGLLLCPNHDKLFDGGYISFDDNGSILISEKLENNDRVFMNVTEKMSVTLYEESKNYMEYHREYVFQK